MKARVSPRAPIMDRIHAQVEVDPDTGCWIYQGRRNKGGYGRIGWQGTQIVVHRITYQLLVGPVPEGLQLDHLCNRPPCCNPEHLEPVTAAENMRRAVARRPRRLAPIVHGTKGGYDGHRRRDEPACDECKAGAAAYVKAQRHKRLARKRANPSEELPWIPAAPIYGEFSRTGAVA